MIKHVVMWKFKDEARGRSKAGNVQEFKSMLEALDGVVPGIRSMEVGVNVNPGEAAFDLVLYTAFDSVADLEIYQNHPEHLKVKEFCAGVREDRVVVDYEG